MDELRRCDRAVAGAWFDQLVAANVCGIGYGHGGLLIDGNDALLKAIGAQALDLEIGISLRALFGLDEAAVRSVLRAPASEYDLTRIDGTQGHVWAAAVPIDDLDCLIIVVDLSERKAAELAIRRLALHDPTTGVPNRRLLMDRLEHALARARRDRSVVALLFCDIDRFKEVNDRYGHRAGDAVLQTAAMRLASVLRQYDTVARVGGDEFVILLGHVADRTDATHLAERARVAIKQPMELDDRALQVTASVGIAVTAGAKYDADTLLRRADDAMYLAKARGRDQVAFDPDDLAERG